MKRHAKTWVAVLLATFCFGAPAALALQTHERGADFEAVPPPDSPCCFAGLAVDGASGQVYVADPYDTRTFAFGDVFRFGADGAYDPSFELSEEVETEPGVFEAKSKLGLAEPADVAVDSSGTASDGNIYIAEAGGSRVDAIDSSGALIPSFGDSEPSSDGRLHGTETPGGIFSRPCGLAVDQSNGNLFVADQSANRIWIYDNSGKYLGEIADSALNGPCGLALDSSGELYVRNPGNGNVLEFHRAAPTSYAFAQTVYTQNNGTPENSEDDGPSASDVAVDTSNDHLYVDLGDRIREYESSGGVIDSFAQGALGGSGAIAVDPAAGEVYAADGTAVHAFSTTLLTLPDATTGAAEGITGEGATVTGSVDAAGGPEAECEFEYGTDESYGESAPCEPAGPYPGPEAVHADIIGLAPATTYHYRLHATSSETGPGAEANGADRTFTTDGPPLIESASVGEVGTSAATLRGQINPSGAATAYRFEYTTEADFQANGFANATRAPAPDAGIGSGSSGVAVSQPLSGLSPATAYEFRLVASNAIDAESSAAKRFATFALARTPEAGEYPGRGFLPDHRAWEMASPPEKGADVLDTSQEDIRAAAAESPGLPMAISYMSFNAFGDAVGTGGRYVQYISERTAQPGTNGWSTHAITPENEPTSFLEASSVSSLYQGEFTPDLTAGAVMPVWRPLVKAPEVANVPNLYVRDDLRAPGPGHYRLVSDCPLCIETDTPLPTPPDLRKVLFFVGASEDLHHAIFESRQDLAPGATGGNWKLYKYDDGSVRLMRAYANCPGFAGNDPCSVAGKGAGAHEQNYAVGSISADGSRVFFSTVADGTGSKPNSVSRLFGFDDRGTPGAADDVTIPITSSERAGAEGTGSGAYATASASGDRVFFTNAGQLTETPGGGLYMWARQGSDERQRVAVDASGGTFTLTAHSTASQGSGDVGAGSDEITGVQGAFAVGQTISGAGIPAGATIQAMSANAQTLTLSAAATATAAETPLSATIQATTPPLPASAGAGQVQGALEGLPLIGEGNVSVGGGPGGAGAPTPYEVSFTGGLAGVDVMKMSADGSALSGGASTAQVTVSHAIRNLSLIGPKADGVIGASEDGRRVYFLAGTQLVPGGPAIGDHMGIFYWQDADGTPGGTLSYVGSSGGLDNGSGGPSINTVYHFAPRRSRVTPDGKALLFEALEGSGLAPQYEHGQGGDCGIHCFEAYVYHAEGSTPLEPDVQCASCNPGSPAAPGETWLTYNNLIPTSHVTRGISDDGRYVFFSTVEPLAPEDTNGQMDAYEYDTRTEEAHLLSSGRSSSPSFYVESSADGHDVFISTRERLSGWDVDGNIDVYDARIDGGLPEPPPPPPSCQGDACQPQPAQLNDPTPASSSFAGAGNANPHRRHRRRHGHHRRHRSHRAKPREHQAKSTRRRG